MSEQPAVPPLLKLKQVRSHTLCLPNFSPCKCLLQDYKALQGDLARFGVLLTPEAGKPQEYVAIRITELLRYSDWANVSHKFRQTQQVLHKVVQSLYTGKLTFSNDTEELFRLASAMQIDIVTKACTNYLLWHCNLSAQQLAQLCVNPEFFTTIEVQTKMLQMLYEQHWVPSVYTALVGAFAHAAAHQLDVITDIVQYHRCGAVSLLQVCQLLMDAGMTLSSEQLHSVLLLEYGDSLYDFQYELICCKIPANINPAPPAMLQALMQCKQHQNMPGRLNMDNYGRSVCSTSCISHKPIYETGLFDEAAPVHLAPRPLIKHVTYEFSWLDKQDTVRKLLLNLGTRGGTISLDNGDLGEHIRQISIFVINVTQPFVTVLAVSKVDREDTVCHLKVKVKALVDSLQSYLGFIGVHVLTA